MSGALRETYRPERSRYEPPVRAPIAPVACDREPDEAKMMLAVVDFMVSTFANASMVTGRDPVDILILATIGAANGAGQAGPRPVSRLAVGNSIGLSKETARRRINRLLETQALVEISGGLILAPEALDPQAAQALQSATLGLLRRFLSKVSAAEG